jgi:hypothetical protein
MTGLAPLKYKELTLVPFYSLHECRYMVYWPLVSEEEWKVRLAKQEADEMARIAIEMLTADKVTCGEQQPENDHFAEVANSRNGNDNNRHWRMAGPEGWFSYVMNPKGQPVQQVRIVCTGREGSEAAILVNGIEAGRLKTMVAGEVETHLIDIPESQKNENLMTITIKGTDGKATPRLFEVRLYK